MSFDWRSLLSTVAPGIATALGGPLAGMAVSAIGKALNVPEPTQEKIQAALAGATPEDMLKIKQAEEQFQKDMKSLDIDLERIAAEDRDSARKGAVASGSYQELFWLSILILSVTVTTECIVLFVGYPEALSDIVVGRILGLFDAVTMMVLSFWYGTTKGSQQKDATINALSK